MKRVFSAALEETKGSVSDWKYHRNQDRGEQRKKYEKEILVLQNLLHQVRRMPGPSQGKHKPAQGNLPLKSGPGNPATTPELKGACD